jgi:hypothetical protein
MIGFEPEDAQLYGIDVLSVIPSGIIGFAGKQFTDELSNTRINSHMISLSLQHRKKRYIKPTARNAKERYYFQTIAPAIRNGKTIPRL